MPLLDVTTDTMFDPDLMDTVTVQRRTSAVDTNGRIAPVETDFENVAMSVNTASKNDLARLSDSR